MDEDLVPLFGSLGQGLERVHHIVIIRQGVIRVGGPPGRGVRRGEPGNIPAGDLHHALQEALDVGHVPDRTEERGVAVAVGKDPGVVGVDGDREGVQG